MTQETDIKVVGFDLDQTLYPKSPNIDEAIQSYLYHQVADSRGCGIDEARALFNDLYKQGEGLSGSQTLETLGVPNAGNLVQEALERADIANYLLPNPEVIDLLERWQDLYILDLITGSNRTNTLKKLGSLSINTALFNHVMCADDYSKSSGQAYQAWLDFYPEFSPQNFLYVGDRPATDHVIPRGFGIQTALVNVATPNSKYDCPQFTSLIELDDLLAV